MITALDHIVALSLDIDRAVDDYRLIMGADPVFRGESDGVASAVFSVGNTAIEILAPAGDGESAARLRQLFGAGTRLASLVFATVDSKEAHRLSGRKGLGPGEIIEGGQPALDRHWTRFRLDDGVMAGVRAFVIEADRDLPQPAASEGCVTGLDHLVIQTPNPDRAVANYSGRLGIRLALDRVYPKFDTRFLFFRIGNLSLEVVQQLTGANDGSGPDKLWGLTWAANKLEPVRDRLAAAGRSVSDIRQGRKPGTRVFTLRDHNLDIPTLFIEHSST